jgi:F0F1-type ATP synthase assembly protein I
MEFAITFGAMLCGGIWLDRRLETLPAFTLVGLACGFALGLWRLIRRARSAEKDMRDDQTGADGHES